MTERTTLAVHRCRFVDYMPSAITAFCFPPLPLPSVKGKKTAAKVKPLKVGTLAVGRVNGNIELYEWTAPELDIQAPQAWAVKKTLAGPYPSNVDSLAMVIKNPDTLKEDEVPSYGNLRLFSAGGSSELVEWDLEKGHVRRTISSQGGTIWSVCPNPASSVLALGCEDGSVRLLSVEYDTLTHLRRFDRVKSRILSIAWGPAVPRETKSGQTAGDPDDSDDDDDDNDWSDSWLVAGCSDSSLRKWDVATGRVLDRMGTDKIRGERTLVWAVGVLGDGTIISGDSMGMVKFWDSLTCTQVDSFAAHAADVLCMTISPEGTTIYTSGVDQKIIRFSQIKTTRPEGSSSLLSRSSARWIQSTSRHMHSHDVRALAIWPPYICVPPSHRLQFPIDVAPILVSGGLDMSVAVTPAALPTSTIAKITNPLMTSTSATFEDSYHRRLWYNSGAFHASGMHLARKARLLLCTRDAGLTVWRILKKRNPLDYETLDDPNTEDGGWERVLDMDLNVNTTLVASAISDDGKWIAVSDWYETKLFRLGTKENGDLKPRRIRSFGAVIQEQLPGPPPSTGASSLLFTPDSTKLVLASSLSSYVMIVDLGKESSPRVLRVFEHHRLKDAIVGNRVVKRKRKHLRRAANAGEDIEMADAQGDQPTAPDATSDGEADPPASASARTTLLAPVTRMAISPDGQWLATVDALSRTHVFNLDAITHHAVLPTFPAPVHALAFDAADTSTLVLGLADNSIQVYDVEARAFPRWANAVLRNGPPERFKTLHDPIIGVCFDPGAGSGVGDEVADAVGSEGEERKPAPPRNALFWGATWLCRVKLDAEARRGGFEKRRRDITAPIGHVSPSTPAPPADEKERLQHPQRNFRMITRYRLILFVDFIGSGELVVVERPLIDVLAALPPAYYKPRYGKT